MASIDREDPAAFQAGREMLIQYLNEARATEALEIATYDSIEILARELGDAETARLAERHRADEERMLAALRELLPDLTRAAAASRTGGQGEFRVSETGAADAVRDVL